jgi:hypothetical protein
MALHPDIVGFFLFFLGARIAEAKYVSFWDIVRPYRRCRTKAYIALEIIRIKGRNEMIASRTYRRSGWSRHRDVNPRVCFLEVRDRATGA